ATNHRNPVASVCSSIYDVVTFATLLKQFVFPGDQIVKRRFACVISAIVTCTAVTAGAQTTPDWQAIGSEAVRTIQEYVRINTSNPPGDVLKAADFLTRILEREGIPVKRYDSGPGRSIVLARLKGTGPAKPLLLLYHMHGVPTALARWRLVVC